MTLRSSFGLCSECQDSLDKYSYGINTFVIASIYQEDTKARQQYCPIAARLTSPLLFTTALCGVGHLCCHIVQVHSLKYCAIYSGQGWNDNLLKVY